MSPQQEERQNKIYDLVMEMHGDMKAYKVHQDNDRVAILEIAKDREKDKAVLDSLIADKNKATGAVWLISISGFLTGLGALITALFKHS
jgi:hypothetical protein